MRKETLSGQWKQLYEVATRIKKSKPWEGPQDMDSIAVRSGAKKDIVFYNVLGRGGGCYGITAYEGCENLNSFLMLSVKQSINLRPEYVISNQKGLTRYQRDREKLADKQRKFIKNLDYSYRGKSQ